jgi:hypothetical protein
MSKNSMSIGMRRGTEMAHKRDLHRAHSSMLSDMMKLRNRHCRVEQLAAWARQRRGCQDYRGSVGRQQRNCTRIKTVTNVMPTLRDLYSSC